MCMCNIPYSYIPVSMCAPTRIFHCSTATCLPFLKMDISKVTLFMGKNIHFALDVEYFLNLSGSGDRDESCSGSRCY